MASCWGITDGSAGMISQVKALAEALGLKCDMKKIAVKPYYAWLPNGMFAAGHKHVIMANAIDREKSDELPEPWPDLIISCGKRGSLIAMGMRHQSQKNGGKTKFINIQDPRVPPSNFDLVIAMEHDPIRGVNVGKIRFALHNITPAVLERARIEYAARFATFNKPHIAVLLGGSTNKYKMNKAAMKKVVSSLQNILETSEGSLLITPSRRTGEENIAMLNAAFSKNPRVFIYDGIAENPYIGMLALADAIFVTNDSVNMMSEAQATGKPVYILPLAGHKRTKPSRFADMMVREKIARVYDGKIESWSYEPSKEVEKLAKEIKQIISIV